MSDYIRVPAQVLNSKITPLGLHSIREHPVPLTLLPQPKAWLIDIDLTAPLPAWGTTSLNNAEIEKTLRFHRHEDRVRCWVSRNALRVLLGHVTNTEPSLLRFQSNSFGKPHLEAERAPRFNLSHAGRFALITLSQVTEVGIDIEHDTQEEAVDDDLRQEIQSPVEMHMPAVQLPRCRDHWVAKEACLKALGIGLSGGMNELSVLHGAGYVREYQVTHNRIDWPQIRAWPLEVPQGYAAALAVLDYSDR